MLVLELVPKLPTVLSLPQLRQLVALLSVQPQLTDDVRHRRSAEEVHIVKNLADRLKEAGLSLSEADPELEQAQDVVKFNFDIFVEDENILDLDCLVREVTGCPQIFEYVLADLQVSVEDILWLLVPILEVFDFLESHLHDDAE